ncbi:hypothetical protein EDB83DRAFT_76826 [Lactarius deliciosus]|nr:hypothetical protein EDB83DRAFT_76826 [Lactarius deliciosus]
MDHKAIFGIIFVLGLFFLIEVGYACVGFRVRFARFIEVSNCAFRPSSGKLVSQQASNYTAICTTSDTVMERLSSFRIFKFIEKAADAYVDAHDINAASSTPPTHGRSGGPGNFSHST